MKAIHLLPAFLFFLLPDARADQFATGQAADVVLGQVDFTSSGGVGVEGRFLSPSGIASDPSTGKVFVSDQSGHRILRFSSAAAATNGSNAEAVFGQLNFNGFTSNQGGAVAANTLSGPGQIAFDSNGRLWVADTQNHRVLGYLIASITGNNVTADFVFGQPGFTTNTTPGGSASATTMNSPSAVWVDGDDALWVADSGHHRILRFDNVSSKGEGAAADGVIGQGNFTDKDPDTTNARLNAPKGICVDDAGRLWVADSGNHRVLRFDDPANPGFGANAVLGQSSFLEGAQGPLSATGMNTAFSVFVGAEGTLWVSDRSYGRLLGFRNAAAKGNGAAADLVIGKQDFTSSTATPGATLILARNLFSPSQVSAGANGSLWVCDTGFFRAVRYTKVKPPRLKITTRSSSTIQAKAPVAGTAAGEVTKVTQRVGSRGPFRKAKGTTNWSFTARLKPGRNPVTVLAEGPGGPSAPKQIVLTRRSTPR